MFIVLSPDERSLGDAAALTAPPPVAFLQTIAECRAACKPVGSSELEPNAGRERRPHPLAAQVPIGFKRVGRKKLHWLAGWAGTIAGANGLPSRPTGNMRCDAHCPRLGKGTWRSRAPGSFVFGEPCCGRDQALGNCWRNSVILETILGGLHAVALALALRQIVG